MKKQIHIGNEIDMRESAGPLADAIVKIVAACAEARADREVSLKALEMLKGATSVSDVTISHCTISNSSARDYDSLAVAVGDDEEFDNGEGEG